MEDKKKKREEKKKKETSQKVPEQNVKVPESNKPSCSQPPTTPASVSPSPGPVSPSSPSPTSTGPSAPVPPAGVNNAKQRTAVANGQPTSLSGNQTSQQQRYMSREVPPRFRCQQDHKVLLKRGQPPLSSMLLGGGGGDESTGEVGGGSGWLATPSLSSQEAENTDTDSNLGSSSSSPSNTSSSLCVTALSSSSTPTNSTYANSTWGAGSVNLSSSQGCDKIIVDGTDLDSWPSIQGAAKLSSDGSGGVQEQDCPGNKNSSASCRENLQQREGAVEGTTGKVDSPTPPCSSAHSSFSSQNECGQTGGVMWSSSTSCHLEEGLGSSAFYNSKVSHLLPGPQDSSADGNNSLPGATINPNVNPSAWPALVQGKTSTSATSLSHEHIGTAELDMSIEQQQQPLENPERELGSSEGAQGGGPRPNREDSERGTASEAEGESSVNRSVPLSSSSAVSSSWKPLTSVPSAHGTGGSQQDQWGGGQTGVREQEGNLGGFGNQGDKTGWGKEHGFDDGANIQKVSQGAWKDRNLELGCGDAGECGSSNNLAIVGCGSKNNSSRDGAIEGDGRSFIPDSVSLKSATKENAWDNQKGVESGCAAEQQGQGTEGDGHASSEAGTENGGEGTGQKKEIGTLSNQTSNAEVALLGMLNRSDLDPRVLSNTGWGQTQIRQNVAWDLNTSRRVGNRNEKTSSIFSSATLNSNSGYLAPTRMNTNEEPAGSQADKMNSSPVSARDTWDNGTSQATRGSHISDVIIQQPRMPDKEGSQGTTGRSWGDPPPENHGKGWAKEEHHWGEQRGGNWREKGQHGTGWTVSSEDKGTGGWKGSERGKVGGWGDWAQNDSKSGGGWGDGRNRGTSSSDEGSSWGNPDDCAAQRGGWAGGDVDKSHQDWGSSKHHTAPPTPNQVATMKTHPPGGWDSRPNPLSGGPPSKIQNQSSGWVSGPIPQISGNDSVEPSGWDEPSSQSISRKVEIDDGTSAWGDPINYHSKNVNLWDKNRAPSSGSHSQQAPAVPPQQPPRRHGDANSGNTAVGPGMWGGPAQSVDNVSGSWNQTSDNTSGWGDSDDPKMSGWGCLSPNPSKSTKSMETWGAKGEGSIAASRHPSWEEEDDSGVGIWNSTGSQGSSSSFNSGGWSHGGRRGNMKVGSGDNWVNPMSRQFSNMGPLGEDTLDKKDGDKRGIADYNGDSRRGGRSGGGYRMSNSKDMGPVDMSTYGEKIGSHGMYVGSGGGMHQPRGMHQPTLHPMNPSQGLRAQVPHPFLSAQVPGPMLKQMSSPGGSVVGGVGGVGSVGGSVGGTGGVGGGGGVFPQLSPQQLAVLSNITNPHMQQFHLAYQLLLQQQQQQQQQHQLLQNHRKFPQPLRQQLDSHQLARIVAILQQRQQHSGAATGSSKLSPSHLGGSHSKQPMVDSYPPPGVGGHVSDQHSKMQGMYSGFATGGNLSGLELGNPMMGGMKDIGGQQSRFKWMMEGHSPAPSPPDSTLLKNGSTDNWQRTPGSKMGIKTSLSTWPPEFQPGVPWNGMQNSGDLDSDPYITPSSVLGSPGPSTLNDSDHQLLRDNIGPNTALNTSLPSHGAWPYSASDSPLSKAHNTAKYSEYKSSWPPEPIGQSKSWKANRNSSQLPRPPPGLTNQKQGTPSPWGSVGPRIARGWGGGGVKQDSRFGPGTAWSDGVASRGSSWLLLSNLTPQIDGSTLKTICMQHGPLLTFHLGLTQGSALIRYSSRHEAAKAQGALHMCVLGNTTILAEFLSEEEVAHYFAHCQAAAADETSTGGSAAAVAGMQVSSGAGGIVSQGGASSPGSEGAVVSTTSGGDESGSGSGMESASVGPSGVMSPGSGWQGLEGTGSESTSSQSAGLGIFSQWSANGSGGVGSGTEHGRSGLWGGMAAGYHSSGLWGAPQIEERHQMDSPAALLPGDLLGGGGDSI